MQNYHLNEGHFQLPQNWQDESSTVLAWDPEEPHESPFSITINRDEPEFYEKVQDYLARQIEELKAELTGFELAKQKEARLDNEPAKEIEFFWFSDGDKMVQRQLYVIHNRQALVFTASAMQRFSSRHNKIWQTIIDSFRFRDATQ